MKILNKLAFGAAALVALTGCTAQKKVEEKEFTERVAKIEEHEYSSVTMKIKVDSVGTGDFATTANTNIDTTVTFTKSETGWTADNAEYASYSESIMTIKDGLGEVDGKMSGEIPETLQYSIEYYVNPFKIVVVMTGQMVEEGMTIKYNEFKAESVFNKYGYPTKIEVKSDSEMSMVIPDVLTMSGTIKTEESITFSYK